MNTLCNKSILIIDDDTHMLRALNKVLTAEGAEVSCAAWAGDAIEMLSRQQRRIDLVIADLRLPILNGMTVVYSIHEVFPTLPVIVLTAFGSPETEAECRCMGAVMFLEKPLDTKQLLNAVAGVLELQESGAGRNRPEMNNKPRIR